MGCAGRGAAGVAVRRLIDAVRGFLVRLRRVGRTPPHSANAPAATPGALTWKNSMSLSGTSARSRLIARFHQVLGNLRGPKVNGL